MESRASDCSIIACSPSRPRTTAAQTDQPFIKSAGEPARRRAELAASGVAAALAGLLRGRLRYVSALQRAQAPAREELLSPATANGSWGRPTALLSVVVCWWRRAGGKVIHGDGHTRSWIVEQSFACEACHYLLQLSRSFIACY